jgi:hypothetical protein
MKWNLDSRSIIMSKLFSFKPIVKTRYFIVAYLLTFQGIYDRMGNKLFLRQVVDNNGICYIRGYNISRTICIDWIIFFWPLL